MKKEPGRADFECFQDFGSTKCGEIRDIIYWDFGKEKEEENEQLGGAGTDGNDLYLDPYRFCAV